MCDRLVSTEASLRGAEAEPGREPDEETMMSEVSLREQPIEIRRVDSPTSPIAQSLIGTLNEELSETYPEEGATHFRLDPDEVAAGRGAFLVAFGGDRPVGCGAIRRIGDDTAEIKRMYVERSARGRGIGRIALEGARGGSASPRRSEASCWRPASDRLKRWRSTQARGSSGFPHSGSMSDLP